MTTATFKLIGATAFTAVMAVTSALAGPIEDRIAAGEPLRIGFANIPIWAYPGDDGQAEGFVNEIAVETLASMGYDNVETVVTDWAGLIPGLKAGRYDMVTGGLYILNSRCQNIDFSEPVGNFGDAFLVPTGNPKNITTYKDVLDQGVTMVTGAGYNTVESAKKEGLTDAQIMQVPGPTEVFAAVKAGRADAGILTYFEVKELADKSDGALEVTDPALLPDWTKNFAAIGFRPEDADFLAKYNAAQAAYMGTDEMMATVTPYGYTESHLPGDITAEWACANR
ncbi:transporter substrate-binding domain-containing protein [Rhodobacteraceae bacterium B1Z28]|uniref:Transporter substrate-binding domain-containing protein n=1 Tax=Ruegeria haliotis TaxID=2747601 RepID=A0ABX2PR39_9RHOB|nr:transporter substrate-binding domain-containing protein [Ruegeria haliotis]NVO56625.1 transporter substrate-binding domain-containing protein [Ruegeria haliotis]